MSTKKKNNIFKNICFFIKKYIFRIFLLTILIISIYLIVFNIRAKNTENFIYNNIVYEQERLQNAINKFYILEKEYPFLEGNENSLDSIISKSNGATFIEYYGTDKLYEIPENKYYGNIKSNKISSYFDGTGGWVYNKMTGEIYPNIKKYTNK